MSRELIHPKRIAYFTMEIALRPVHLQWGLGVLAGDTVPIDDAFRCSSRAEIMSAARGTLERGWRPGSPAA